MVSEGYLRAMEPTVPVLSQILLLNSLAMNKLQVEFCGLTGNTLAMIMLSLLLCWLGAGACAGIIAMSATYPMNMVRGRITVQTEKSPRQDRGMFHALGSIYRQEGFRALYKGWLPSVIGVILYTGLNFAVYESLKDWLLKTNPYGLVKDSELSVITRLACGAVAGAVGQTVAYPLDVIRRRMLPLLSQVMGRAKHPWSIMEWSMPSGRQSTTKVSVHYTRVSSPIP